MRVAKRSNKVGALRNLARAAATCTACELYKHATQTVFGEGDPTARIILVGEQPGHEEDLAGHPFVGPAGRLLDKALAQAGLDRRSVYVTNAVKHFKWKREGPGKRRIHDKPRQSEIDACKPWFKQEVELIQPSLVVCLGATAATALLGRGVAIKASRGRVLTTPDGVRALVTVHPSAILRMPDPSMRREEMQQFVADLETAARLAARDPGRRGDS
jgi:DNA polymerase